MHRGYVEQLTGSVRSLIGQVGLQERERGVWEENERRNKNHNQLNLFHAYIDSRLVGLVGQGMWLVWDEWPSWWVLQHDVADLANAQRQSIRST